MLARSIAALAMCVFVFARAPALAQRARARSAQLELQFTAWERGVGTVHTLRQSVRLVLDVSGASATLRVSGSSSGAHTELSPAGPGATRGHSSAIDERYTGTVTRRGGVLHLALVRAGSGPTLRWRCAPDPALDTSFPDALRCEPSDPPDALAWHNGGWTHVPIVLAPAAVGNHVTHDGQEAPWVQLRPAAR